MECLLATISRESLTLPPLQLGVEPFLFDGSDGGTHALEWGGVTWQRDTADSPWVHGTHQVAARKGAETVRLRLWVVGADLDTIRGHVAVLAAALGQWSFTLTVTSPDGYAWQAWTSDMAVTFDRNHLWNLAARVDVDVPCQPLAIGA